MKLVVDTHHLMLENAGTKRVTINLLAELKRTPGIELIELQPGYSLKKGASLAGKLKGHFLRFFWVYIHLPFKCYTSKADFLLSPEFNTPMFCPCPRAVIAHDAHMRAQREFTSTLWFYFYYVPFIEVAIRRADLIFTVSQFAKRQIVDLMRLDQRKVHVVYNGVDQLFFKSAPELNSRLPGGLVANQYILFVGTFEARKNIGRLLEAFSILKIKHTEAFQKLKLAIVGQSASGKYSDSTKQILSLIKSLNLTNDVVFCGYVADAELPIIYQNAKAVAFPSLHEGFGLPIIEAFASNVPVLTSNLCSMPEIAGGAALLIDPYEIDDISSKLERLLFDEVLRQVLTTAGTERVKEFTWETFGSKVLAKITSFLNKTDVSADT
ncbi:glycosyltransferase family 1 protein [uncultured Imperialibacter sp.]|uniref:glycosyltransferase family 4 protein n=1 Tax=uncultured Imperialibacter sp. TaxID=1672639 RepID=UPI0030DB2C6F|tara:strand:- start:93503 stop:94645 length:1143 start_codon:yes stop_codon:yes gene_type:complete